MLLQDCFNTQQKWYLQMAEYERRLIIHDENWRDFFKGSFHQQLSLSLSEAYSQILKVCIN